MKKLGFGLMRLPLTNPDDQTAIDMEQVEKMAEHFCAPSSACFAKQKENMIASAFTRISA